MTTIKFTKQTNREFRTTKDGFVRTNRTADALKPLVDGVKNLEQRVDAYSARVEQRLAEERRQRLVEMVDAAFAKHERDSLRGPCTRIRPRHIGIYNDD